MTDREKLIDICMDTLPDEHPWDGCVKQLVDALIANGVTFQPPVVPGSADCFAISEMAYNNGYARGLEEGKLKWVPAVLGFYPDTHEVRTRDFDDIIVSQVSDMVLGWDGKRMEVVEFEMWNGKPTWTTWNGSEFRVTYWAYVPEPPEVKDEVK